MFGSLRKPCSSCFFSWDATAIAMDVSESYVCALQAQLQGPAQS